MITLIITGAYEIEALYVDGQFKSATMVDGPDMWAALEILKDAGALAHDFEVITKFSELIEGGFDIWNDEAWPATLADALRMLGKEAAQPVNQSEVF